MGGDIYIIYMHDTTIISMVWLNLVSRTFFEDLHGPIDKVRSLDGPNDVCPFQTIKGINFGINQMVVYNRAWASPLQINKPMWQKAICNPQCVKKNMSLPNCNADANTPMISLGSDMIMLSKMVSPSCMQKLGQVSSVSTANLWKVIHFKGGIVTGRFHVIYVITVKMPWRWMLDKKVKSTVSSHLLK